MIEVESGNGRVVDELRVIPRIKSDHLSIEILCKVAERGGV